jgi:hypothetical protein
MFVVLLLILSFGSCKGFMGPIVRDGTPEVSQFRKLGLLRNLASKSSASRRSQSVPNDASDGSTMSEVSVESSFVDQKNVMLLKKLLEPEEGLNQAEASMEYVNFCDEGFNTFLDDKIANAPSKEEKEKFGRVRYEVNRARQKKLIEADKILRDILSSGELKQIENRLNIYLRRSEIDMAFMVILQLNIEDALRAGAKQAVQIMTHLETCIMEYQDQMVSPPVRLMRMLVRAEDSNVRKQMLRQKLLIGTDTDESTNGIGAAEAQSTTVPQCEHIIVNPVEKWGGAEVTVEQLEATLDDVMAQMTELGATEMEARQEFEEKCNFLRRELKDVVAEFED